MHTSRLHNFFMHFVSIIFCAYDLISFARYLFNGPIIIQNHNASNLVDFG